MNDLVTYTQPQALAFPRQSVAELYEMAKIFVASGMYAFQRPEQAVALMLVCQSEGIDPVQAMKRYHIIQGRPAVMLPSAKAEGFNNRDLLPFVARNGKIFIGFGSALCR